ncbi:MAG TPA: hypothetical protein VJH68_02720 [Candidatus Nanoarchaeia archaeon]|nr:hypothetical protein [Candidatus Nanoarchaeia archaeon]
MSQQIILLNELSIKETAALYQVAYEDKSGIRQVTIWKEPAHSRLELRSLNQRSRYALERLVLEQGNAKLVCRRVRKTGNYILTPLDNLPGLMKELHYFGRMFKPIFMINPVLSELYQEEHFFDFNYCWRENII